MKMKHRIAIAVTTATVALVGAGVADAGTSVNLKNAACPSSLSGGAVGYHCTLSGTGGKAALTTVLHLKGATISGTMTLKLKGHSYTFSVSGPVATNKAKRVVFKGTYHGDGGSGTVETIAPPNQPTAPGQFIVKGSL
jgi:hypothetical protein